LKEQTQQVISFRFFVKERGDTRVCINSLGEGAIWIIDINGNLEAGDYITSSHILGYGQKQDSEFLANYTVAKITMDCDFEPQLICLQRIKRGLIEVTFYVNSLTNDKITEALYKTLSKIEQHRVWEHSR